MSEIELWRCPDCGWVGYSEDGHCRQFDEHPDGPRIPLRPVEYVPASRLQEATEALRESRQAARVGLDSPDQTHRLYRGALARIEEIIDAALDPPRDAQR